MEEVEHRSLALLLEVAGGRELATTFVLGLVGWMLDGLDEATAARAVEALRATTAAHETPDGVVFGSAAWLVTARRP